MSTMFSFHHSHLFKSMTPRVILLLILAQSSFVVTSLKLGDPVNFRYIPGLSEQTYSKLGDINIGVITQARLSEGPLNDKCSDHVEKDSVVVDRSESFAFAVDLVNRDPTLLPNVSLGFTIRDMCSNSKIALATSLSFLPRTEIVCQTNGTSVCYTRALTGADPKYISHDVIGVISPEGSATTVPISTLYGIAHLPLMGFTTTSDELSDKGEHPYFFRVVTPDKYSTQAMLKFISTNGWSFISMLYTAGSYGEKAYDNIKENAGRYGICIATSHRMSSSTDFDNVVTDLLLNSRARVVVLFLFQRTYRRVLQAVADRNASGHFVWIGADGVARYTGHEYEGIDFDPGIGTFTFDLNKTPVPEYFEYLRKQTYLTTKNPWYKQLWEHLFKCSFSNKTCDLETNLLEMEDYNPIQTVSLRTEAVLSLAHAAHSLLADRCPHATGIEARECISGELLREYLQNTSFLGYSGRVQFDENQDMRSKYIINQFVYDVNGESQPFGSHSENRSIKNRAFMKPIGFYDIITETITFFNVPVSWSHLDTLPRIVPVAESSIPEGMPESVCSRPCVIGEYKIEKELPCCWECWRCRDNERIDNARTTCEKCPLFQWPDLATNFTTCVFIPLTYPRLTETLPIVLTCLAIVAILVTVSIFVGYIVYRHERVVKAGSRELSLLQLVAIFVGYITVILFQTTPTDATCGAIYFMFCMSFAWLYSPLLVKVVRIFRIFQSSTKYNRRPRFVSPKSQVIMAAFLINIQIILCATTYAAYHPRARQKQPVWSEKLVELSCDLTLPGLASFLTYNLVLVSLCSVFAFKTRKLPDNFNESKFISMCVSTTLLIWLAFIPTYYTSDRTFVHALLLSTALLLNHSVALLFLFVPKIYAAIFLPPEATNANTTRFQTTATIFSASSNRVAPALTPRPDTFRQRY